MAIGKELLDQLLAGRDPQELFAKDGLIDELKKALSERMLAAELDDHLESEAESGGRNRRNGTSQKTMLTGSSKRSEEHTSELQSLMRISYAVFCLKKKNERQRHRNQQHNMLEQYTQHVFYQQLCTLH